ncbi:MAG: hypothetical protein IJS66_03050 [Bacteroidales bacterium]|nr:hypothetical protein [Bacteroidales bacterium]
MNIRNIRFLLVTAATAILACGCPQGPEPPGPDPDSKRPTAFSASLESIEGVTSPAWTAESTIKVYLPSSPEGKEFHPSAVTSPTGATFAEEGFKEYHLAKSALFPASFDGKLDGENLSLNLPAFQYYCEGGVDPALLPFVAQADTVGNLSFKCPLSVVAVTVKSRNALREIRLVSNKDEALWGTMSIPVSGDDFPAGTIPENAADGKNAIVLSLSTEGNGGNTGNESFVTGPNSTITDGTLSAGGEETTSTYYFAVPAGTLQEGFRLTMIDHRGGYMQQDFPAATTRRAACSASGDASYKDASEDVIIRTDVQNKAFYKDLVMNSGLFLTTNDTLPVTEFLDLSMEVFMGARYSPTKADSAAQTAFFVGSAEDVNGRMLYPDGEPRFKMVYVRGGGSTDHGYTLGAEGRDRFRKFVAAGGSYLGSCAGAYLACRGVSLDVTTSGSSMAIWPGHCNSLSTKQIYPGHVIPEDSPLLKYYDFGGDYYIDSVRHHNGPCFINYDAVPGTEVLTRFDIPDSTKMHGHPAIIAWKKDKWWGRVIPCGSHPEQVPDGENLLLMAGMVRYCFDGLGNAKVKGILHNGEIRRMVKSTEDKDPAYTKIGDKQCHHFVFALPEGARNIKVRLESLENYDLSLHLAKGTFAFKEDAQYKSEGAQSGKQLFFDTLEAGTWYVGVQCESTVTVIDEKGFYGTTYSNTGILNGAPYTIQVTWDY